MAQKNPSEESAGSTPAERAPKGDATAPADSDWQVSTVQIQNVQSGAASRNLAEASTSDPSSPSVPAARNGAVMSAVGPANANGGSSPFEQPIVTKILERAPADTPADTAPRTVKLALGKPQAEGEGSSPDAPASDPGAAASVLDAPQTVRLETEKGKASSSAPPSPGILPPIPGASPIPQSSGSLAPVAGSRRQLPPALLFLGGVVGASVLVGILWALSGSGKTQQAAPPLGSGPLATLEYPSAPGTGTGPASAPVIAAAVPVAAPAAASAPMGGAAAGSNAPVDAVRAAGASNTGDDPAPQPAPAQKRTATAPRRSSAPNTANAVAANGQPIGYLTVDSRPSATVLMDGVKLPERTPLRRYQLPVGQHELVFRTSDGRMSGSYVVVIEQGEQVSLPAVIFR